ncbi:MAG: GspE/PulE family protein [Acidimicrobiia bacterium]
MTTGRALMSDYSSDLLAALKAQDDVDVAACERVIAEGRTCGLRPLRALYLAGVALATLERAAWNHQGFAVADVVESDVDVTLLDGFPVALARRLQALPIARTADMVTVAMVNPTQLLAVDEVRRHFAGEHVIITVVHEDQLATLLDRLERNRQAEQVAQEQAVVAAEMQEELDAILDRPELGGSDELSEGRIARLVKALMDRAATARASDVHLEPGERELRVRFRIDGVLHEITSYPVAQAPAIINRIKVMANLDVGERRVPQDGRYEIRVGDRRMDVRLVTLPTSWGVEGAVMRILDRTRKVATLEVLGYSEQVLDVYHRLIDMPHGAILATGPTGSGKTTALYASLARIATPDRKVLTIEDPVEYRFAGITQVQVNEKAGLSFPRALRAFLRADPDIVLVGELRDQETARVGIQAALTGHLVLSTLHANSAVSVPSRLIDMGIEPFLVSSALKGVIAQRLVRRLCEHCREEYTPIAESLAQFPWPGAIPERLYRARSGGCSACERTGYAGRFAIAEVFPIDEHIASAVAARLPAHELEAQAKALGYVPMFTDGLARVEEGRTSLEELSRVVS